MKKYLLFVMILSLTTACVSKKKLTEAQAKGDESNTMLTSTKEKLAECEKTVVALSAEISSLKSQLDAANTSLRNRDNEIANLNNQNKALKDQYDFLKASNNGLMDRLSDLSVISKAGADNIKKSLEQLDEQNKYIKQLSGAAAQKDSMMLALVMNLKRSLADVNDQDVTVEVKGGVVYVSISDKLLFKSGSSDINTAAQNVLAKISKVVNDHKDLQILVEGHTDNVPFASGGLVDNWDLSVKRATSVVRTLQKKYAVAPERMTAGGRSEFVPKSENSSSEGRASNRRTEILILPKLDQFFQLMTAK